MNEIFLARQNSIPNQSRVKKNLKEFKSVRIDDVFEKKITVTGMEIEFRLGYEYLTLFATFEGTDIKFETSSIVLLRQFENLKNHLPVVGIIHKVPTDVGFYYDFCCTKREPWVHGTSLKNFVNRRR
jgi:hypothetical protein